MKGTGMKNFSGYTAAVAMLAAATLAGCPAPSVDYNTQVLTSPNTIDGKQLYFIPSEAPKRAGDTAYVRVISASDLQELPVDPAGSTPIDFSEDTTFAIDLGDGGVFYFGEYYSEIFVSSDGTIAFGAPGGGNATVAAHFSSPQISLLPVDATITGTVSYANFDNSVVVTFDGITIDGTTDNAFQAEFFKTRGIDGDIALSYPQVISTADGLVGLSNGELAGATQAEIDAFVGKFRSSNLSANSANTSTAKLGS